MAAIACSCATALAVLASIVLIPTAQAGTTVTASKQCVGGTPDNFIEASFSISTPQIVAWTATVSGGTGLCSGDAFYLSTVDSSHADILLTDSGSGSGTQFLNPGTYHISIHTLNMGPGSYSITFDRTATAGVSPSNHTFPSELEGDSSTGSEIKTFNITQTGDLSLTGITATVESGASFFEITASPAGAPPTSFKVRFNAGTIAGSASSEVHTGTIRVRATSVPAGTTVPDVIVTVSGTTTKRVPEIACAGTSPGVIRADHVAGQTVDFDARFKNEGTEDLNITAPVELFNDSPGGVFTMVTAAAATPLAPGATRAARVRFAPPPTAPQDQVFLGHIVIHSDDPDEPDKQCSFSATAHEPRPIIRVEPVSRTLNYHDVELGFAYDLAVFVHNDGDAPLVFNVTQADPADPDRPQWSALGTPASVTIAPGGPPSVLIQRFEPQVVGGPFSIILRVTGTNHPSLPPPIDVTLVGSGAAPIPVNSVLVLDRSGSMADSAGPTSKMGALRIAAQMWADLLRAETGSGFGDAMGMVKYNNTSQEYAPLHLMDAPHRGTINTALEAAAIGDLARLKPDEATGIGGGMQRGADMLSTVTLEPAGSTVRKHVMVVMTDGIENRDPRINDVLPGITGADSRLRIYSLGLGDNLEIAKLQSITNRSPDKGFHQVSGDLTGTQRFDLQTFYFKILVDSLDWQMVVDPTYVVNLATTASQVVSVAHVCSSDREALFVVMDEPGLRGFYDLQLLDPGNHIMTVGASVGGVPVQVIERENYRIFKVVFPDLGLSSSYVGDWTLLLTPNGKWKPDPKTQRGVASDPVFTGTNGLAPIGFGAAVGSNYRLDVGVSPTAYEPNSTVTMTASLSDRQWPSVTGSVFVDVTKPSGSTTAGIELFDDGTHGDVAASDGTWTNRFGQTFEAGSYKFFFSAVGKNDRGELAPRQATRYVSLVPPGRDPSTAGGGDGKVPDEPCIPCRLQWWLWGILLTLLVIVIILLIRLRRP
ncbi:MAG: VWA domain-containing protein [Phycisphaerales bacterium]|nr:VWA domain-containing protein [Phycisphaerales bacterium]